MHLRRYATAAEFVADSEPFLLESEAENNLILGIAHENRGIDAPADPPQYWASIHRDGAVVGCAFRTPPHPVALTRMPLEAIRLLTEDLRRIYRTLPGVNGPPEQAEMFADRWSDARQAAWRIRFRLRIHHLERVMYPANAPSGELREPLPSELPLVRQWAKAFIDDTGIIHRADEFAEQMARSGRLFFWDDNGPRCMVAAARATRNGTTVSAVYTPPAERRRGYASVAVATLSQQLLDAGNAFCSLYTDCANPTSNAIYRRIGYEPVSDAVEIEFSSG